MSAHLVGQTQPIRKHLILILYLFFFFSFPDNRDTHGINTVRMAEVWMDEYIDLFFMNRPDLRVHNSYNLIIQNVYLIAKYSYVRIYV